MDKYLAYEKRVNRSKIIAVFTFITVLIYATYDIFFSRTKLEERIDNLNDLNHNHEAEVIEITEQLAGSQGMDGGKFHIAGYIVKYKYFYKGNLYQKKDFVPKVKGFENMIQRCLSSKKYDVIQIRMDTLNPNNSMIRFISPN